MKRLRELWRLRKQYDSVKLAPALFLCAACFFGYGTVRAVGVSLQRDRVITADGGRTLTVSELSAEYLYRCYGIESGGSGRKI